MTSRRWLAIAAVCVAGGFALVVAANARPACAAHAQSRDEATFVVVADTGGGPAQDDVAAAMRAWADAAGGADAIVTAGDNVHPCGQSEHFEAQLEWPYENLGAPIWTALGNHDVEAGFGGEQLAYLGLPSLPYSRAHGGVEFFFLDSNRVDAGQAAWLDARLAGSAARHKVVVMHHPPYSCGYNGSTHDVIESWVPVIEAHDVSAVISGHNHSYERMTSDAGVTYVVAGGGGVQTTPIRAGCELPVRVENGVERHHFVGMRLADGVLHLDAVGIDGEVFDSVEIRER